MWTFIQDQILGMKWLNTIIGKLLLMVGLDVNSRVGGSTYSSSSMTQLK